MDHRRMGKTRTVVRMRLRETNLLTLASLPTRGNLVKGAQRLLPQTICQRLRHPRQPCLVGLHPVSRSHLNLWLQQI